MISEYLKRVAEIEQDEQQSVAFRTSGSQVVVAGPGSGKTYLLTTRVAQTLLKDIVSFPQRVTCITFSRRLAADLRSELHSLGVYDSDRIFVGTIHAFCISEIIMPVAGLLPKRQVPTPFRIASNDEVFSALASALQAQNQVLSQSQWVRRNIQSNMDKFRRLHFNPDDGSFDDLDFTESDGFSRDSLADLDWRRFSRDYVDILLQSSPGSIDFVGLEMLALLAVRRYPSVALTLSAAYPWWFVDEYQDLSPLFHKLVNGLVATKQISVFAIGDPNQCIYEELHGSKPHFLEQLAETVQRVSAVRPVTLNTNYRSAQTIIDIGDIVLGKNTGYESKLQEAGICHAVEAKSYPVRPMIRRTLERLCNRSEIDCVAILAPDRGTLREILMELENNSPWSVAIDRDPDYSAYFDLTIWVRELARWCSGQEIHFYELLPFWHQLNRIGYGANDEQRRAEADQLLFDVLWGLRQDDQRLHTWLRALVKALDFASLIKPYELIRPDDVVELRELFSAIGNSERLSWKNVSQFANPDSKVFLTTLHSSKGLEFDAAIVVNLDAIRDSATVPDLRSRLAYVAVTRAKTRLHIYLDHPKFFAMKLSEQSDELLRYWVCDKNGQIRPANSNNCTT